MELRAPQAVEVEAVTAVLVACDMAEIGEPNWNVREMRDRWARSSFAPASDAIVAQAPSGELVAYAEVTHDGTLAGVAPTHVGQGIGARILNWTEQRERELRHPTHRQLIAASNDRARALLIDHGYTRARSYQRMARELTGDSRPANATLPATVTLRELDVDADAAALHALDDAAFKATGDYSPEPFATFVEEHLRTGDVQPQLSLVALGEEGPIGFLVTLSGDDGVGHVDLLAVHPDHRRNGIGSALMNSAFALHAAAGLHRTTLSVASDNATALRLYERLGMTERFRHESYERAQVDQARIDQG
jgi:mycothiol synthase